MAHNHTTLHKVSHAEKEKTRLRTTLERDPGSGVSAWRMVSSSATGLTLIRKMPSVPTELPAASLWNSSQQLQVCSICSWPRCNESACRGETIMPSGVLPLWDPLQFQWSLSMDIIGQIYYSKTTPSLSYTGHFKTTNNGSPHWPLWLHFELLLYSVKILWVSHTMSRNYNTMEITS